MKSPRLFVLLVAVLIVACQADQVVGWDVEERPDATMSFADVRVGPDAAELPDGDGDVCEHPPEVGPEVLGQLCSGDYTAAGTDLCRRTCVVGEPDVCVDGVRHACVPFNQVGGILETLDSDCCELAVPDLVVTEFEVDQDVLWSRENVEADLCGLNGRTTARLRGSVRNLGNATTRVMCEIALSYSRTLESRPASCTESYCDCLYDPNCTLGLQWNDVLPVRLGPGEYASFDEEVESLTVCPGAWYVYCRGEAAPDGAIAEPRPYQTTCRDWTYDVETETWSETDLGCTGANLVVREGIDPMAPPN